jgi:FKBP-type peptidyl-prolyl cis-trans isomerase FkpA
MIARRLFPSMKFGFVLAGVVVLAAACNKSPSAPSLNVPFSQTDLVVGTGAEATAGKTLTVTYVGWLYDPNATGNKGTVFDTNLGGMPYTFVLGSGTVIPGWDQGLPGMKAGGQRRLVIPPALAYGNMRFGPIPANSTLLFEVVLNQVQ